ncbi:MAG: hypothetical protein D4R76_02365 [Methylococcus sp.]|nr:MAG: hypothetical protein D4R76_02365 [Methylococcus sp.]
MAMVLEVYIWSWIHLHPRSIAKHLLKLLGISILILGPLFALNVALVQRGLQPATPGLTIDLSGSSYPGDVSLEEN